MFTKYKQNECQLGENKSGSPHLKTLISPPESLTAWKMVETSRQRVGQICVSYVMIIMKGCNNVSYVRRNISKVIFTSHRCSELTLLYPEVK